MDETSLIEKIVSICENFGEKFSKGNYFIADNVKFKSYGLEEIKRVQVVEGDKRVFNYVNFGGKEFYTDFKGERWKDFVKEYWNLLNKKF
ncbi:MAG TPA: hypothetical protein VJ895_02235 [Candidatus Nanoarchaeia archaeon]|nr:hypothetical protein [Candidatus Nanoarchaeia archaeon]